MKKIFLILISTLLVSCAKSDKKEEIEIEFKNIPYVENYKDIAIDNMIKYKIPASITLAQGILESGMGTSRLAKEGNNHFGIKCGGNWKGKTIRHHDDKRNECFRKYKSVEESYADHSNFLQKKRYQPLFKLKTNDYKGWARGLKKLGYATSNTYDKKLISIIEKYKLYIYDK